MKKRKTGTTFLLLGILFSFYFLMPAPKLPPPDLPESAKSSLPGDTTQISNVSAYFTEKEREDIISFYQDYWSKSSFFNLPLPIVRISHPPEYAKEIIRDTTQSYYLEELVSPMRGSLFVNGFDWQKDVFTPEGKRAQNKMVFKGKEWPVKVTLRWHLSSPLVRLAVFWFFYLVSFLVFRLWLNELKNGFSLLVKLFKKKK